MTTRRVALLFLAFSAASITVADDKPLQGDLLKFQGTWTSQSGADKGTKIQVIVKGSEVKLSISKSDGNDFEFEGEITLDENTKPHKSIAWRKLTNPDGGLLGDIQSIYVFEDDDTFKVCSGGPGEDRPTEFKDGEGSSPHMTVLKRQKTSEKPEKAAATTPSDAPKGDLAKFQGKWTTKFGRDREISLAIEIKNEKVTLSGTAPNGQEFEMKGEVKVNDQAKPHKTLDWVKFTGPEGNDVPDNLAIYELQDADTIKVCGGGPGNERPTEFKDGEGGTPHVLTLKRSKD